MWRCAARPCRSSGNSHSTFSNKRPQGPAVRLHTGSVGRSHFTFLKLSAKLYTSVFHHGLKVLSLKSQRGVSRADSVQKRKLSPRGSGQRVPPKTGVLCLPLSTFCSRPSRGTGQCWPIKWTSSKHVCVEDGGSRGRCPQQALKSLHCVFLPIQNHVCEPGMVVDACTLYTQETEAGRPCLKRKEVIPTKVTLPFAGFLSSPVFVPLGSAGLLATSPLPLTYLLCLHMNF